MPTYYSNEEAGVAEGGGGGEGPDLIPGASAWVPVPSTGWTDTTVTSYQDPGGNRRYLPSDTVSTWEMSRSLSETNPQVDIVLTLQNRGNMSVSVGLIDSGNDECVYAHITSDGDETYSLYAFTGTNGLYSGVGRGTLQGKQVFKVSRFLVLRFTYGVTNSTVEISFDGGENFNTVGTTASSFYTGGGPDTFGIGGVANAGYTLCALDSYDETPG